MTKTACCLGLIVGVACCSISSAAETVRVDAASGAPRLVVDGSGEWGAEQSATPAGSSGR